MATRTKMEMLEGQNQCAEGLHHWHLLVDEDPPKFCCRCPEKTEKDDVESVGLHWPEGDLDPLDAQVALAKRALTKAEQARDAVRP